MRNNQITVINCTAQAMNTWPLRCPVPVYFPLNVQPYANWGRAWEWALVEALAYHWVGILFTRN